MRRYRELGISFIYLCCFLIIPYIFLKKVIIFDSWIKLYREGGAILITFLGMFWMGSLFLSVYHLFRLGKYSKMIKQERLVDWNYDSDVWRRFIVDEVVWRFKANLKYYLKLAAIIFPGLCILGLIQYSKYNSILMIIFALSCGILLFVWVILKNLLFFIKNMIFANAHVIITRGGIVFNGRYHRWRSDPYSGKANTLIQKDYIVIDDLVSRKPNEIKRFRIPIPEGKRVEAENFCIAVTRKVRRIPRLRRNKRIK